MLVKKAHETAIDIAHIYDEEGVPKFISYPFWFIMLLFGGVLNKIKKTIGDDNG